MTRKEILEKATQCVCGERDTDYGAPENSFSLIAHLWNSYLSGSFNGRSVHLITEKDVGVMMALLKIARIAKSDNIDSFVDLAGYAACAGEIVSQEV